MFPITIALTITTALLAQAGAGDVSQCNCGFEDSQTSSIYTDSLIVYFNETDSINPAVLQAQDFAHKKEEGWNSRYKIGAQSSNAAITNTTVNGSKLQALEMVLDPTDRNHLVNGASLQSTRRDIQYGLFEAAMLPARQWSGGTVLTYGLNFNRSNGAVIDFMNSNDPSDAQVANLVNGEYPASNLVTNFTTMQAAGLDPWKNFTDVRFSWNKTDLVFDIAGNQTRLVTSRDRTLPTAGQALQVKTWSIGYDLYGGGPPMHNATQSHVLWVRAFFNSSQMTVKQHEAFDHRCEAMPRCATDDISLRGYTPYSPVSTLKWKEPPKNKGIRTLAGVIAACCSSFGIFALMNVFLRRTPWHKLWPQAKSPKEIPEKSTVSKTNKRDKSGETTPMDAMTPGIQTPLPAYGAQSPRSATGTRAPSYHSTAPSVRHVASIASLGTLSTPSHYSTSSWQDHDLSASNRSARSDEARLEKALRRISEMSHLEKSDVDALKNVQSDSRMLSDVDFITPIHAMPTIVDEKDHQEPRVAVSEKGKQAVSTAKTVDEDKNTVQVNSTVTSSSTTPPKKRVDYLAGLTALACIGVTLHHFGQTFWPYVMEGYGPTAHYPTIERWLHIFVGNITLSNLWIGPFFLTATRFLSANYLRNGNLEDIAKKELRRAPRLFVPIIIVSLLQYFLVSMGLTYSLQWLPSVTYSTWPYVIPQPNFAVWINNMIELAYLIPNAVPEITTHYCIGVLWTLPVQLQFTYVVLAAAVVIRDIRVPWKRFGIYALVILAGWYARSWSACHWAGVVLSDLEATYNWRKWLKSRPIARYTILVIASSLALGATLTSVFDQRWSFNTYENSIHPDHTTGKPIITLQAVYPDYDTPTLALLLFSIGLQVAVELSTWVQAFLSLRFFIFLNPMIYTIYLTHGFVMWTWGAWVSLACNSAGMPYWANLLVTLVTTYTLILLLALILTPLLDYPTQALMRNIDWWTKEEPIPKRPTTTPFSKDLVLNRKGKESATGEA